MTRLRRIEIRHFRSIAQFVWCPGPGLNALIGSGDAGKSSVLDAIDLCLGARRNVVFGDDDFFGMNVDQPIVIEITVGELDDALKNLEAYGLYLRGFRAEDGAVVDEPEVRCETVLTVRLTVQSDLEPQWQLVSDRAAAQGQTRHLAWADRLRIAPGKLGARGDENLSWRRGSVLNRLSDERADASAALVRAGREARLRFGDDAQAQLGQALKQVLETANQLGVPVGDQVKALLDAHAISVSGGAIALHNAGGVPLRSLGLGSARLLVAGLQRAAAADTSVLLVDEIETGLEPHRIYRLLVTLGAKEQAPPLQVFLTTHSPVVVRELSGTQLYVLRQHNGVHLAHCCGNEDDVQGTMRRYPEALLGKSILVCEGASEVGLIRGMDQASNQPSISTFGVVLVDGSGSSAVQRALAFQKLGYRVALLRDSDVPPKLEEEGFKAAGGAVFAWRAPNALEDELFQALDGMAVAKLWDLIKEQSDLDVLDGQLRTASGNVLNVAAVDAAMLQRPGPDLRRILGKAARSKHNAWFKSVTDMERIAREIVAHGFEQSDLQFKTEINRIFGWCWNG
ncbi:Predicted ATP-dependent endonuclease of the OLD family, contains P-loop ATPase and TOPRIM domains [Ralstonia sp. 25mfcol4.1]|uniref:ATP-dependent nuclease n=1 Tax=Ralstonia sp. 25mfcol4.1 TaxID=1761899 RepID=UPI00089041B3|nr:ATP-binding protein [Ralstonia sp. 25mfcol4.1]SDP35809.1 Predicted ATP-dependent endonuclease of the OLD family, contains P-loop ATPase and TOPRIM domains [Ralstonia sp. 25mfcol4.1]